MSLERNLVLLELNLMYKEPNLHLRSTRDL